MTDLIVVPQAAHWQRLKRLVLDSVSSPITRRVYNLTTPSRCRDSIPRNELSIVAAAGATVGGVDLDSSSCWRAGGDPRLVLGGGRSNASHHRRARKARIPKRARGSRTSWKNCWSQ